MDITRYTVQQAAEHVGEVAGEGIDVHTVTLITNGYHGGVDCKVEGFKHNQLDDPSPLEAYERTFELH